MYIRLVTSQTDPDSHVEAGVFQFAYALAKGGSLEIYEERHLKEILVWFEKNLPLPDRSRLDERAIFWFKGGADECARRIWDLAGIVEGHGLATELVKTTRPGYVVYEDDYQVAAIPFRDTFTGR